METDPFIMWEDGDFRSCLKDRFLLCTTITTIFCFLNLALDQMWNMSRYLLSRL